jgi:phospholipase C
MIGRVRPAFRLIEPQIQYSIVGLIWQTSNKRREHSRYEDAVFFTHQELDRKFGRAQFLPLNNRLDLFDVSPYGKAQHARGYTLKPDIRKAQHSIPIPTVKDSFIFEWLKAHDINWRVYHCGISFFALFDRFEEILGPGFRSFRQFPGDWEADPVSEMPQVVFIEPEYTDSPVHLGWTPNDNHPPTSVGPGEHFLRSVYQVLTKDPEKWKRTMLVVTHDEHGGFFDHVPPLAITVPVPEGSLFSLPFQSTGPRVPSFALSRRHRFPPGLCLKVPWIILQSCSYFQRSSAVPRTIMTR